MDASPRFLQLADVAEILNTSSAQVYALVRRGDLPAIKIGGRGPGGGRGRARPGPLPPGGGPTRGRGQWRVEASELEAYIQRAYAQTREFVEDHPYVEG